MAGPSGRLAGKTAFITAAGQGMGRAAALAFAREGAKVWATDINAQDRRRARGKDGIQTRVLDVTDEAAIREARRRGRATSTCCSTAPASCTTARSSTARRRTGTQASTVNVKSMYLVTRAFLPGMLKKGRGSIINMASVASSVRGLPNRFVYGATRPR